VQIALPPDLDRLIGEPAMRYLVVRLVVVVLLLVGSIPSRAAPPPKTDEPLGERVRTAIQAGVRYLRDQEGGRGQFGKSDVAMIYPGGVTALATLALLDAGVPSDDPLVQRCLKYLRTVEPRRTYVVSLQTMVYVAAGQTEDRERIQRNVDWLLNARRFKQDLFIGWSYEDSSKAEIADNSNTEYAVLALHGARLAGAGIKQEVWQSLAAYYGDKQGKSYLNWGYRPAEPPTPTMTCAALCGLAIADLGLATAREARLRQGKAERCDPSEVSVPVADALALIDRQMPGTPDAVARMPHTYYWLHGLEQAGELSGEHFLGGVDWYRLGCEFLVKHQDEASGSWKEVGGPDDEGRALIGTSFALLFLARGRAPVLVSKLAHDPDTDWSLHGNDARHLVAFAGRELFKKQPLAWQVFDTRRAGELTREHIEELAADLAHSPIVYLSGSRAPSFQAGEEELLKRYVAKGGFLYADACGGSTEFDKGFRDLVKRLFPNAPLTRLSPDHPVWHASGKFTSSPKEHELWGIEMDGRTVAVYSPQGLSAWWEHDQFEEGKGQEAFRLGANIIALATGLKPPRPRLSAGDAPGRERRER
jgi:hypothetical protein